MPLTEDRNTKEREGKLHSGPAAANKKFYAGGLCAYDASGNITPGAAATTLIGAGRVDEQVDNTGGNAGDKKVPFSKGTFQFANSASGDLITRAEIGDNCYIVDDQTVAKTDGTGTRSIAGKIVDVDAAGVWVLFT